MTSYDLAGKVTVVTGAAAGIGRAILWAFAREGAKCVAVDLDDAWGSQVASRLRSEGAAVEFVRTDVSNGGQVAGALQRTLDLYGGMDVLVNCAGAVVHKDVVDLSEEEWDHQMDVQLKGVFLMCRGAARVMIDQRRGGRIINIGSSASAVARMKASAHCASKAGLVHFTRVLALELGRYGITCNVVAPGLTDVRETSRTGGPTPEYQRAFLREVPLGRLVRPDEVAEVVLFFASERAGITTGQVFYVDGGYSAGKLGVLAESVMQHEGT